MRKAQAVASVMDQPVEKEMCPVGCICFGSIGTVVTERFKYSRVQGLAELEG